MKFIQNKLVKDGSNCTIDFDIFREAVKEYKDLTKKLEKTLKQVEKAGEKQLAVDVGVLLYCHHTSFLYHKARQMDSFCLQFFGIKEEL